ncbi:MAG TPA: helix-turn-helix domain-containing protein [Saprospiraceae bacterium]|nr:helix-turn-helix domain-containing protein [Saprospiraceae bacterium]
MTQKKGNIIQVALRLFSNDGFNAVSTAQIAKEAGVSEGLIFRHFESKKGLLDHLYEEMEKKVSLIYAPILATGDAKKAIRLSIEFPFTQLVEKDQDYWRLMFRLKWQEGYDTSDKMRPWRERLARAFRELNYAQPELETQLLERTIEGIATTIMQTTVESQWPLRDFLLQKYEL